MRKVLWIVGCIILAGGLFALDYWQGYNNQLVSGQLKQDNLEIQQLLNEKAQLEVQTEENDLFHSESVSKSKTPEERISEIDQQLDDLYH